MKELIQHIITDIGDNKSISDILLDAQIIAYELKNEDFSNWIRHEQQGYPNSKALPEYRKPLAKLMVDINQPFIGITTTQEIPGQLFENEDIQFSITHANITCSLSDLEILAKNKSDGFLIYTIPNSGYKFLKSIIDDDEIIRSYFWMPISTANSIIQKFIGKLIEFLLQLDEEKDIHIDFSTMRSFRNPNQTMNNTYYVNAVNANLGNGNISTGDINIQTIDDETKSQLSKLIEQIKNTNNQFNSDTIECIDTIKEEIDKPNSSRRILRMLFKSLSNIVTGVTANLLSPLITQALNLL